MLCERDQPALGRGVGRDPGDELVRERRTDVDDCPVALALQQVWERGVEHADVCREVGLELLLDVPERHLVQPEVAADGARVVDHHVQFAEGCDRGLDDLLRIRADVALDDRGAVWRHRLQRFPPAAVEGQPIALGGQRLDGRGADTGARRQL